MSLSKSRGAAMAAQFKTNAAKVVEENWERPARIHIPAIAPDFYFEFIARRVDITSLLYSGELPESFSNQVLRANVAPGDREAAQERAEEMQAQMTPEDRKASLDFQVKLAKQVCVAPRLMFVDAERAELEKKERELTAAVNKVRDDDPMRHALMIEVGDVMARRTRFEMLAAADDTLDLSDVPFSGDLIIALFNYAMGLSPDVPVATTDGGQTTLQAVETFPDGVSGQEPIDAGDNGAESGNVNRAFTEDCG
jgi:hypothetical protein